MSCGDHRAHAHAEGHSCPKCGSTLVTQSTCPDGYADCFNCGAVFTPSEES
jgi:hypothetical protein